MRKHDGFTLVELMVVVLVIGILAAIAVPIYIQVTNQTKAKTCDANVRSINSAIQIWAANNPSQNATIQITDETVSEKLIPHYLLEYPECPFGTTVFPYLISHGAAVKHSHPQP